jgi:hypothetical protein
VASVKSPAEDAETRFTELSIAKGAAMTLRKLSIPTLVALAFLLGASACGSSGAKKASSEDQAAAVANVRAAVPAVMAYYQDNGTYRGMTDAKLARYDAGVAATVINADADSFCIEAHSRSASAFVAGPAGGPMLGTCADKAKGKPYVEPTAQPEAMDPATAIRASIPAIEAYGQDHNASYLGMTLDKLRNRYDAGLPEIKLVTVKKQSYCIDYTDAGATAHLAGPTGQIAPGSCPA